MKEALLFLFFGLAVFLTGCGDKRCLYSPNNPYWTRHPYRPDTQEAKYYDRPNQDWSNHRREKFHYEDREDKWPGVQRVEKVCK